MSTNNKIFKKRQNKKIFYKDNIICNLINVGLQEFK